MRSKKGLLLVFGLLATLTSCISLKPRQRSINEIALILGTAKDLMQRLRGPPEQLRPSAKKWLEFRKLLVKTRNSPRFRRSFTRKERQFVHYLIAYTAIMFGNHNCTPNDLKSYICTTKFHKMVIGLGWCQEALRGLQKISTQERTSLAKITNSAKGCIFQMRANIACYKLKECGIRCRKLFLRLCPFCPNRLFTRTNYLHEKEKSIQPSL